MENSVDGRETKSNEEKIEFQIAQNVGLDRKEAEWNTCTLNEDVSMENDKHRRKAPCTARAIPNARVISICTRNEDEEDKSRCIVCGSPAKHTVKTEYTNLSSCPDIEREIRELLKILSPSDSSDVCCGRCLDLMEAFIDLKNGYQSMRRKIIALHIDAQLQPRRSHRLQTVEGKDKDSVIRENKKLDSSCEQQDQEVLVKHETNFELSDESGSNSGPKLYECSHCDKMFSRKSEKIMHERNHTGEKPFECKHCPKAFTRKNVCVQHEKQHSIKPMDCSQCGKTCWGKRALVRHEKTHTSKKPYKCKECDKAFSSKAQLEDHERVHTGERPYLCQYCTKSFAQSSTLRLHERTQHTGERPFKCQYCDEKFPTRLYRTEHERFHTGEKPFKCDYCEKRFVRKANWQYHIKIHTGVKPHVCSFCGKGFLKKDSCVIHERTHTGDRPFKCQYCGKGFSDKSSLARHERTHTGERPYRCRHCDKTFAQKSYCNIHEKTHTREKPVNNQKSNKKIKSPTKTHKSPPQPDLTRKDEHTEDPFLGHPSNINSYVRHQVENAYRAHGQHTNSTLMRVPPESNFSTGPPDNTYRPPNTEISYRGPHSNNVFPTPEAVYPGDNTESGMYSIYMSGL